MNAQQLFGNGSETTGTRSRERTERRVSKRWRAAVVWLGSVIWILAGAGSFNATVQSQDVNAEPAREIDVRGRVVCLAEAMHQAYGFALPGGHEHLWGFKSVEGKYYTLLRSKLSEGLFVDERLRQKELIIKGRAFPGTLIIAPVYLRSVKEGRIFDVYYYCDICAIKTLDPGECMCCQGPVELVEQLTE